MVNFSKTLHLQSICLRFCVVISWDPCCSQSLVPRRWILRFDSHPAFQYNLYTSNHLLGVSLLTDKQFENLVPKTSTFQVHDAGSINELALSLCKGDKLVWIKKF
jgi:hypothetical protein